MTVDLTPDTQRRTPDVVLVLSGGHALGAYLAGAFEAMDTRGLQPGWIVGCSIGAVTGAILAGNPPERRLDPEPMEARSGQVS